MPVSIDERLRLEIERTSLRKLGRTLPDVEEWRRAVRIINRATQRRVVLKESYARDREARVDAEQRRLIHAAGAPERNFVPSWAAVDRFDPVRTKRQAETAVRDRHERLLGFVDRAEAALLRPLVQDAQARLRDGLPGLFALNARPGPVLSRKGPTRD